MRSCVIHDLPDWRVTSLGNGLAYAVEHKPSGRSLFFQGDDADEFQNEFEALTERLPTLDYADALQIIFQDYEEFI